MMIAVSRDFARMTAELVAGNYLARTSMTGREVSGKTVGIVGFGKIGRRVGEIAHLGFGMTVLYNDIVDPPAEVERRCNAHGLGLRALLEASDYVQLHVPLDASPRRQ